MRGAGALARVRAALLGEPAPSRAGWRAWLAAALGLTLLHSVPNLERAFSGPYVVQDDARQHVFWMRRFEDPGLFPRDPIADYFQAVAPPGYTALYRAASASGVDPLVASKLLPVPLALACAAYAFALARRMLDAPAAAFAAAGLLSVSIWMTDDLASGTPRAFAVPLLIAFLYYLSRRSSAGTLATLALQGLFYPHVLLISCGTLLLWTLRVEGGRPRLAHDRSDLALCAMGLALGLLIILPFASRSAEHGPVVTESQARGMAEFLPHGRSDFFGKTFKSFWFEGHRSGVIPKFFSSAAPFILATIPMLGGLLLPALRRMPRWFPAAPRVTRSVGILARLALASLGLFAAAHLVLFRLHLPSRYVMYSLRVGLALAGAVTLALAFDAGLRWAERAWASRPVPVALAMVLATGVAVAVFLNPTTTRPGGDYVAGRLPEVYRLLASRPADTLVASISDEADNVSTFARRPVLVSREHAIPYHLGYYLPFRARVLDLIRAEYAEDPRVLRDFVRRYGVDYFLLDRGTFEPAYVYGHFWIRQFRSVSDEIAVRLGSGGVPALERLAGRCTTLETARAVVVDAACVEKAASGEVTPLRTE